MYKLILFDLGGVLFTNGTKKFISVISERYNLPIEKVREAVDGELGTKYRESQITRDEFWKQLVSDLLLTEDIDKLEDEWISYYELIPKTKEIISELSKKYEVYYLSDNVKERVNKLDLRFDFLKLFDGGVFSHEVGVRKPNPKIYEFVLNKAGVNAAEAIFIDDKETALVPAKEMGIKAILFENPEKLEEDLRALNVI